MALDPSKLLAGDAGGLIWVVIVIVTIIAQIMKAAKKAPPQPPGTPGRRVTEGGEEPAQELQDFLRNLSQGMEMPSAPPPLPHRTTPPPPPSKPRHATTAPTPAPRQPPTIHSAPRRAQQAQPPAAPPFEARPMPTEMELMRLAAQAVRDSAAADAAPASHSLAAARAVALLRDRDSLRSAVLLREILGAPLGWRLDAGAGATGGRG